MDAVRAKLCRENTFPQAAWFSRGRLIYCWSVCRCFGQFSNLTASPCLTLLLCWPPAPSLCGQWLPHGTLVELSDWSALHRFRNGDRMTHHLPNIFRARVPAKHFCLKADGARRFLWSAVIFSSGPGAPAGSLRIGWMVGGGGLVLGEVCRNTYTSNKKFETKFRSSKLKWNGPIENGLFCIFKVIGNLWRNQIYTTYIQYMSVFLHCFPRLYFSLLCCSCIFLCGAQIAGFALFRVTFQTFAGDTWLAAPIIRSHATGLRFHVEITLSQNWTFPH